MNNDELFCYFINQLDYYENHPNEEKEQQWYFQYLIDMSSSLRRYVKIHTSTIIWLDGLF